MGHRTHGCCGRPDLGGCGRSCCGAPAPASYTRSFSLRVATWNQSSQPFRTPRVHRRWWGYIEPWPHPSAPVSCSLGLKPGHPASRPRDTPHLSLELLADGGVLADMTVQADHVALQLRGEHRGEMCLFIQSSFKQPRPTARHCARSLTHIPVTHPHDWGNRPGKVSGSPEATTRGKGCL